MSCLIISNIMIKWVRIRKIEREKEIKAETEKETLETDGYYLYK